MPNKLEMPKGWIAWGREGKWICSGKSSKGFIRVHGETLAEAVRKAWTQFRAG